MTSLGLLEAKTHLSALVDRAAAGEEITITRHGKPVARLVPAAVEPGSERARAAFEALLAARKGVTLGGLDVRDLIDEGRP